MRKGSFETPHEQKLSEQLVRGRLRGGPVVERRTSGTDRDRMGDERLVGLFLGTSAKTVQLKVSHLVLQQVRSWNRSFSQRAITSTANLCPIHSPSGIVPTGSEELLHWTFSSQFCLDLLFDTYSLL